MHTDFAPPRSRVLLEQISKNVKCLLNTIMDTGCENFEVHDLKSLHYFKKKVNGNMYIKIYFAETQKEVSL